MRNNLLYEPVEKAQFGSTYWLFSGHSQNYQSLRKQIAIEQARQNKVRIRNNLASELEIRKSIKKEPRNSSIKIASSASISISCSCA